MRNLWKSLVLAIVFGPCHALLADAPATQFFVLETVELTKLAPTDEALASLTDEQLTAASIATGWYEADLHLVCETKGFRIDASFHGTAEHGKADPKPIYYHIDASTNRTSWNLFTAEGAATLHQKQYIADNWRKQRLTIVLRFVNLKQ